MGERALRDTGLISNFARLVLILGHGSNCLKQSPRIGLSLWRMLRGDGLALMLGRWQRFLMTVEFAKSY